MSEIANEYEIVKAATWEKAVDTLSMKHFDLFSNKFRITGKPYGRFKSKFISFKSFEKKKKKKNSHHRLWLEEYITNHIHFDR